MKVLTIILATILSVFTANAAIDEQKAFDNTYVGIEGGVFTPMTSVFPVNGTVGIKLGKQFNPVYGLNVEGTAWFGSYDFNPANTVVRATTVGANLTMDVTNFNYNPNRKFHVVLENGLGWLHYYGNVYNNAYVKNSVIFEWTPKQAWSFYAAPTVYWNLANKHFNKLHSQVGLNIGVNYHFKTSNGTHSFVKYDINALNNEINLLREEVANLKNQEPTVITEYVETTNTVIKSEYIQSQYIVFFAQNSYDIVNYEELDKISEGTAVNIVATASPEGSNEYNQKLSEKRAEVVAEYLKNRGIEVNSCKGLGVVGDNSNRVAIVTISEESI